MALTPKQERFVEEYLIDLNATAAAGRAGYKGKYLDRIGPELLGKTGVAAAIAARQAERSRRTHLTQDEVIAGLRKEAAYMGDGAQHTARVKAWELLGKHQSMFVDVHEHTGGLRVEYVEEIVSVDSQAHQTNGRTQPRTGGILPQ